MIKAILAELLLTRIELFNGVEPMRHLATIPEQDCFTGGKPAPYDECLPGVRNFIERSIELDPSLLDEVISLIDLHGWDVLDNIQYFGIRRLIAEGYYAN